MTACVDSIESLGFAASEASTVQVVSSPAVDRLVGHLGGRRHVLGAFRAGSVSAARRGRFGAQP